MATKTELVAFGQAHGVDVDSSMSKADIEAALTDAGYDPTNLGETTVGTEEPRDEQAGTEQATTDPAIGQDELENTSSDAANSTYAEAPQDKEAVDNPPPGRQVEQHRGTPDEAAE